MGAVPRAADQWMTLHGARGTSRRRRRAGAGVPVTVKKRAIYCPPPKTGGATWKVSPTCSERLLRPEKVLAQASQPLRTTRAYDLRANRKRQVCCPITTDTGSVRLVERCGKFNHITSPGLSFLICCVDSASEPLSMRLQQLEVACETKTKDNVFISIKVRAQPCSLHTAIC